MILTVFSPSRESGRMEYAACLWSDSDFFERNMRRHNAPSPRPAPPRRTAEKAFHPPLPSR